VSKIIIVKSKEVKSESNLAGTSKDVCFASDDVEDDSYFKRKGKAIPVTG
jgi:hypothetical protein